jgi:glucose-1-phosphate thymidylyltransferase
MNERGEIVDFVEKPKEFVSDLAMIGIYYFRDGERLHKELQYLIDNAVIKSGEYQLPDALRRLTESGVVFKPGTVSEWLDCGNKEVTVHTNQRVLEFDHAAGLSMQDESATCVDSVIIQPCFIGKNVKILASVIGPHVSIGANSVVENSIIRNTNIQQHTHISNANLADSMLGSNVVFKGRSKDLSLGDFSTTHE